jgi:demethylmenaquinone methyltransferase/2-methoxy-6-polyprenyl-1,4-benzoquinol methylase
VRAADTDAVLREQRLYYSLRAGEYDDAYLRSGQYDRGLAVNARWQADFVRLRDAFDRVDLRGDVVELAAGTGAWTERIVGRVRSLTVIDGSAEMLDQNRARLGPFAQGVTYQVADLFDWRPRRTWDACVFGFWLCKVPDDRADDFLATVAKALRADGIVCCVDKAADLEPATERETRTLNDGRQFTIIDHPRPPSRIVDLFAKAGMSVSVETIGQRFCLASGARS